MNKTPNWTIAVAALAALCAILLAITTPAWAQPQDETVADPPGRVGRISALVGAVDISREAGDPWERAQINQVITGRTALRAPPGSQAEVRIGSTSVRLDAGTRAVFSQLDDHAIAIDVAQGTVRVRLRSLPTGDAFSLSADAVRAEAQSPGDYRVGYDPERRAYTLRALAGELRVITPTNSYNLEAGQESLVEFGGQSVALHPLGERDDFDAWAEARDARQDSLTAARYVSPETTGIEALDEHGRWNVTEEYGPVWYPRTVRSGWAPYRYGHWAHVHPWGWTWVDDAPWGFAPFHYGRWAYIDRRWGWVPGPIVARPVWSPALVGYVGGYSSGVSVSIGIGAGAPVGWFPLGPHEIYHPPFRYSQRYWDHVNWHEHHDGKRRHRDEWRRDRDDHGDRRMRHHTESGYRYAKRPDAVTVVSADSFRGSRPVGRERLQLDAGQIAQLAPVAPGVQLPTVLPRLRNPAADSGRASPVLRLPAAQERERAGSPRREGGGLALGGDEDAPGTDGRRSPRERGDDRRAGGGPRERADDGDRRMGVRPPSLAGDERRVRGERRPLQGPFGNGQDSAERAARSDRDLSTPMRVRPGIERARAPVPPLTVVPQPRPGLSTRPAPAALPPPAARPSVMPIQRPAMQNRPPAVLRHPESPQPRQAAPDRRIQAPQQQRGFDQRRMEPAQPHSRVMTAPTAAATRPAMRPSGNPAVQPARARSAGLSAPAARSSPQLAPRRSSIGPHGGETRSRGFGGGARNSGPHGGRASSR